MQKVHVRKTRRRAKVDTKTVENFRAAIEQQVKLMVRVAQLKKTMSEARQVAEAAEQDYAFTEEAGSRATELALWATLSGYHAKRVEDRWIVAEFEASSNVLEGAHRRTVPILPTQGHLPWPVIAPPSTGHSAWKGR